MKIPKQQIMSLPLLFTYLSFFTLPILGLSPAPSPSPISHQNLTNSLHITITAAINEAVETLDHINQQQPKSSNESAAFSDCSNFYNLTVMHLNQTLHPEPDSTPFDVQIWLSAALTNLDNCKTSVAEQKVGRPAFLLGNKASELISSGLAINAELMKDGREDLRRWLPDGDALSWPELRRGGGGGGGGGVAVVVAQDGSGNCRTIKEALDMYGSRKRKGKFVIHVKKGTYREIVEIGREMKDVMLTGDGIGRTIITGDRSARSGFSTRESATVSKYIS